VTWSPFRSEHVRDLVGLGLAYNTASAAPLEPIGLIGFAWTSLGPPHVHWIAPMIFSALVGIANVSGKIEDMGAGVIQCLCPPSHRSVG
jgi:hypothetical protein